ncbi:MAG: hypothetical protein SCAL_001729 [Candidatus Syntrophoarchaeum caldarius]|uniref:Uncharacterized protein n=1 Tax=Candidatus Syntropharchaeum caldarium TaxID=1838285 RepID=A0A1F2P7F6_9EURY|nr:MAG: hypothetical protein SCAL_001729 [Candidatus Syntrophoarchaeum caldarius]
MLICVICLSESALGKGIQTLTVEEGKTMTIKEETLFIGKSIVIEPDATLILDNTSILRWKGDSTEVLMGDNSTLFLNASRMNTSVIRGDSVRAVTFDNSDLIAEEIALHASEIRSVSSTISSINISGEGRLIELQNSTIEGAHTYLKSIFTRIEGSTIDSREIEFLSAEYLSIGKTTLLGNVTVGDLFETSDALIKMRDVYLDWSAFTLHSNLPLTPYNTFTARVTNPADTPMAGIEVLIYADGEQIGNASTDQDGKAEFNLPAATIHDGRGQVTFINYTAVVHFTNTTASANFTLVSPLTLTLREETAPPEPNETSTPTIANEPESSATTSKTPDVADVTPAVTLTRRVMGAFLTGSFIILGLTIGGVLGVIALIIKRRGRD